MGGSPAAANTVSNKSKYQIIDSANATRLSNPGAVANPHGVYSGAPDGTSDVSNSGTLFKAAPVIAPTTQASEAPRSTQSAQQDVANETGNSVSNVASGIGGNKGFASTIFTSGSGISNTSGAGLFNSAADDSKVKKNRLLGF